MFIRPRLLPIFALIILLGCIISPFIDCKETTNQEFLIKSKANTSGRSSADLVVDYLSASWTSADAGDSKSVSVRIKNEGSVSSGSFDWALYLSTDTTITTNDIELDEWYQSSLSAGSTRSYTKYVDIPLTISGGRYYVGMIVDVNTDVSESDENNNDDYDSGRVTIYESPDLTGKSCNAPTTGVVGDYLDSSISVTFENDPGGSYIASSGSFDWAMYLSTDSTITSSDTQVGYDQSRSSINGGSTGTDSLSTSNRIPSTLNPGNYYWGFIVDIDDDVSESNENNNAYVCNQVSIEDELPDIYADSVGTSSSSVVMGDTITVSYRIENLGNDYTGSFHWELYLSSDSTITTNDIFVDEFSVTSISAGSYKSGNQYSVSIPTGINPGYYYLGMIADSRSSVTELDESNNVVADTGRIDVEEMADLVPTTFSGPSSAMSGDQVGIDWRIDNEGDDSTGWFYWEAYISTDPSITTSDTKLGSSQQVSSVNAGSYRTGTYNVNLPSSISSGTYYFGIIIDSTNRVDEGDETNNILTGNQISISDPDYDLEASSISLTGISSVCLGGTFDLSVSVTNLGNDYAGFHYYTVMLSLSNTVSSIYSGTNLGSAYGYSGVAYYTDSAQATVPTSMAPGTYYVGLIVDSQNNVDETDENNNIVATQSNGRLTIIDCKPELSPSNINGPTIVIRGEDVQLNYQLMNSGDVDTNSIPIEFFISLDTVITTSDISIGSTIINSLTQGQSLSLSIDLTIPSNLGNGCWYWGVIVDPNDSIDEENELNNAASSSQEFCTEQANLQVVSVTSFSPTTSGQTSDIVFVIENEGGIDVNGFYCSVLLSIDVLSGTDDTQVSTFYVDELLAGTSIEITHSVTAPAGHIGQFHWILLLDTNNDVSEDNEDDNYGASDVFTIEAPSTDLFATFVEGPVMAEPGQTITVEWGVHNLGSESLGLEVEIWLSSNQQLSVNDILIDEIVIPLLEGDSLISNEQIINLAENSVGEWWFILSIDPNNEHDEDDETNNIFISNTTIIVDENIPPQTSNGLSGCNNPTTDGEFEVDAAGAMSSASYLGINPYKTVNGCLVGTDLIDWYSFILIQGNKTTIAFSGEGAELKISILLDDEIIDSGVIDGETDLITFEVLISENNVLDELYYLKIERNTQTNSGPYKLLIVTDNASVQTDVIPPTTPSLTISNEWYNGNKILIDWFPSSDIGSGIAYYEIRIGGGLWAQLEEKPSNLNISFLSDGKHTVELRAVDIAGNQGEINAAWLRIDRTAPLVVVEQIGTQLANPPLLFLDIQINDGEGSGLHLIEWTMDNITWFEAKENGVFTLPDWSIENLKIRVIDGAGLETITIVIITPPEIVDIDQIESIEVEGESSNLLPKILLFVMAIVNIGLAMFWKYRKQLGENVIQEEIIEVESTNSESLNIEIFEGYEWVDYDGQKWYRVQGSEDEWSLWDF